MKPFLRSQLERYAQRLEELDFLLSREDIMGDMAQYRTISREHAEMTQSAGRYARYQQREADLASAREMLVSSADSPDMAEMAQEEITAAEAEPWSTPAFLLRLVSAGLLVPLFEELMMRGFLFRFALQWHRAWQNRAGEPLHTALDERSVNEVEPGAWTWPAVLLSMLAFTSGHAPHEWPAAMAYGLLMTLLWIHRQDLISCVTAHAVTNISLALFVFFTGGWHYW